MTETLHFRPEDYMLQTKIKEKGPTSARDREYDYAKLISRHWA